MVSARFLSVFEKRLHELRPQNAEVHFAGFYIYLVGDIQQLIPVIELPMYADLKYVTQPDILHGISLFWHMGKCFELHMCQRQRGDQTFINFLNRLATGKIDDEDYEQLKLSREVHIPEDKKKRIQRCNTSFLQKR